MLDKETFMDKTYPIPETGCWLWMGALHNRGYGHAHTGGKYGRGIGAHRLSWILFIGPIPKGKQVRHKCDVRCCVNPYHLMLGDAIDNTRDAIHRGRFSNKGQGKYSWNSKVRRRSDVKDSDILRLRKCGYSYRDIAWFLDCSYTLIQTRFKIGLEPEED